MSAFTDAIFRRRGNFADDDIRGTGGHEDQEWLGDYGQGKVLLQERKSLHWLTDYRKEKVLFQSFYKVDDNRM